MNTNRPSCYRSTEDTRVFALSYWKQSTRLSNLSKCCTNVVTFPFRPPVHCVPVFPFTSLCFAFRISTSFIPHPQLSYHPLAASSLPPFQQLQLSKGCRHSQPASQLTLTPHHPIPHILPPKLLFFPANHAGSSDSDGGRCYGWLIHQTKQNEATGCCREKHKHPTVNCSLYSTFQISYSTPRKDIIK